MAPSIRRLLLVLVVSLALLANPLWLFPDEDEMRYTYERSELVPQDDDIAYDPPVQVAERGYYNQLQGVGCEAIYDDPIVDRDLTSRACALEQTLADGGSVTADAFDRPARSEVAYLEIDDGYYRRTTVEDGSPVELDVRRVSTETVVANVTARPPLEETNAANVGPEDVAVRAVGLAEPIESSRYPSEVDIGQVFRFEWNYYAVFVADSEVVTSPVPDFVRPVAQFVGFVGALSAVLLLGARTSVTVE